MSCLHILLNKQIYAINIYTYISLYMYNRVTLDIADITSNVYTVISGLYYASGCLLITFGRKLHGNKNGLTFVLKNKK